MPEEVPAPVHPPAAAGRVGQVQRGDLEHLAGALGVAGRDHGRGQVEEAARLEVLVDGHEQRVAHPGHRAEGVGAQAQVGDGAQVLEAVPLLLQRVVRRGAAHQAERLGPQLHGLALARRGHQLARHRQARARGGLLGQPQRRLGRVQHHLQVGQARAVVELHEGHLLAVAPGAHPALHPHGAPGLPGLEQRRDGRAGRQRVSHNTPAASWRRAGCAGPRRPRRRGRSTGRRGCGRPRPRGR